MACREDREEVAAAGVDETVPVVDVGLKTYPGGYPTLYPAATPTEPPAGGGDDAALLTVTVMTDEVAVLLLESVASEESVCDPLEEAVVSHEEVYGIEVTAEPKGVPSK